MTDTDKEKRDRDMAKVAWAVYGVVKAMGATDEDFKTTQPTLWPFVQAKLASMTNEEKEVERKRIEETARIMEMMREEETDDGED